MHIGVIPDGNRRYARNNDIENREAYAQAKDRIIEVFREIEEREDVDIEIEEATFYLLSEDNLERDKKELETLFSLFQNNVEELAEEFGSRDFSFNWVSTNPGGVPRKLRRKLKKLEEKFSEGEKQLNALISYSGRQDILQASEDIAGNGGEFSRENLMSALGVSSQIDFVVRTGDNPRRECLSGFPIWNASYAEFYHIQKNFPAVETEDVVEALNHFEQLRRKKGK